MNKDDLLAWSLLLILALVWGSSFILIKKGLVAFPPFQIGALRMVLSSLTLLPWLFGFQKELKMISRKQWIALLAVGWIGNGIPSFLFPIAETGLNSATAGILNVLTPIFVWLLGVSFFGLIFSWKQLSGVIIGLVGAVILILGGGTDIQLSNQLYYALLVIFATFCYGLSSNIIKKYLSSLNPILVTALVLTAAAIPFSFYLVRSNFWTVLQTQEYALSSLGYIFILAVIGTALAMVIFNKLISFKDQVFSSSVTYLIPIVAVFWGLLDGEKVLLPQVMGMAVILAGVYLVNAK
ncbi:MAG: DMT family transporter [Bacteroidota bacterium]